MKAMPKAVLKAQRDRLLEFVRELAKTDEYDSYDTGCVIEARWKRDAQTLLEELK